MARVCEHAKRRARERLCRGAAASRVLAEMWRTGRVPQDADFIRFRTWKRGTRDYRLATRHGQEYLVVRDTAGDRPFVTVLVEENDESA